MGVWRHGKLMKKRVYRGAIVTLVGFAVVLTFIADSSLAEKPAGYVVILKNGSSIRASKPMEIQGRQVIITLLNGTVTSISIEQVDLVKTERYNQQGLGSSIKMDTLSDQGPEPTPTPRPRLGDVGRLERRPTPTAVVGVAPTPTPTPQIKLRSSPYPHSKVVEDFRRVFDEERLYLYKMSVGTASDRLHINVVTDSEREVFQAVEVVSKAYYVIHELGGDGVPEMVELQLMTTTSKPAGTFRIDPEIARLLVQNELSVEQFYVRYVIF